MKRTTIVTAAVLMFTGFTSLSIAAENTATQSNQAPVVQSKSVVNPSVVGEKKANTLSGKEHSATPQKVEKVGQHSAPVVEKSLNEKKSEPVAENKPAATLTNAAKTTANTSGDHTKDATTESVKSATPAPSLSTNPAPAVAKTAVTSSSPSTASAPVATPAPAVMPTK